MTLDSSILPTSESDTESISDELPANRDSACDFGNQPVDGALPFDGSENSVSTVTSRPMISLAPMLEPSS